MSNSQDPLEALLDNLRAATPPQPHSVRRDVWRRIADGEARTTGHTATLLERIEQVFSRPAFAVAFVALCILGGLFAAELRLNEERAARAALIEREYVRMIAPVLIDTQTPFAVPPRHEP